MLSDLAGLGREGRMEARIRQGGEKDGTETGKGRIYPRNYPRLPLSRSRRCLHISHKPTDCDPQRLTADEEVCVLRKVAQAFGDDHLGFGFGEGAKRDVEVLREFLGGVPGRAFGDIARNADCRPPNLVGQSVQFMFRKMRRKFVDKDNEIDAEFPCLKMFMIHHADHYERRALGNNATFAARLLLTSYHKGAVKSGIKTWIRREIMRDICLHPRLYPPPIPASIPASDPASDLAFISRSSGPCEDENATHEKGRKGAILSGHEGDEVCFGKKAAKKPFCDEYPRCPADQSQGGARRRGRGRNLWR